MYTICMESAYKFLNYREYLTAMFSERKQMARKFSHRYLAQRLGLSSPTFMMLVMKGKRNITLDLAARISKEFKHTDKEADYFASMVRFAQAKTNEEKDRAFKKMTELRRYYHVRKIEEDQYSYYSNWYNIPIRELVTFPDFKGDYRWLAKQLIPAISESQARRSVELLLRLGLIKKKDDAFVPADPVISTGPEVNSLAVVNFHRSMARLFDAALDRIPKKERNNTACTVSISEKSFEEINKAVAECRKRVLSIAADDNNSDRVYQINFQVFPLSVKADNGGKQ